MAQPDLPHRDAERAVEPPLAQQLVGLAERAALGQRAHQHLGRAAAEHVLPPSTRSQREPRVVLGLGHATAAQRVLGRVPRGRDAQPQRAARRCHLAQPAIARAGRGWSVDDQHAGAEHVRARRCASAQQQPVVERAQGQRPRGRRGAPSSIADPRPVGEDHAPEQRVGGGRSIAATRRARSACRSGRSAARPATRPRPPAGRPGPSRRRAPARRARQPLVAGIDQVQRRQPRQHVDPAFARRPRAAPRSSRRRASGSPASKATVPSAASMRAAVVARRALRQRPLQVGGRRARRRACRAAARAAVSLTSGSACGLHSSRCAATIAAASAPPSSAPAPPRGAAARARCARGPRRSRPRSARARSGRRRVRAARGDQRVARRAELAHRDAGDRRQHVRRRTVADHRQRLDHAAVARRRAPPAGAARRCARPRDGARPARRSSASGLAASAAELGQQPRVAADRAMAVAAHRAGVSGASRRISSAAPRGVSGRGCSTVAERAPPSMVSRSDAADVARAPTRISSGRSSTRRARYDEHLQRRAIGPLRVVDDERQRPLARRAPSTATACCGRSASRRVAGGRIAVQQQLARRRRGAVEQSRAPPDASRTGRLQQRPDDAEGEVLLQRPGSGAPDEPAGLAASAAPCSSKAVLPRPAGASSTTTPPPPASR